MSRVLLFLDALMTTNTTLHLIGLGTGHFGNNTEDIRRKPVNLSKHRPNTTDVYCGYDTLNFTNIDFSEIYTSGSSVDWHSSEWGLDKAEGGPILPIKWFNQHHIQIKKIFLNAMSDVMFCLTDDNKIYAVGRNNHGQMGLGNCFDPNGPKLIPSESLSNIIDIQSGENCSVALCKSDDFTANTVVSYWVRLYDLPTEIGAVIIMFGKLNIVLSTHTGYYPEDGHGDTTSVGTYEWREIETLKNKDIVAISVGNSHSLFLDTTGNVWACGTNGDGQLGLKDQRPRSIPTLIDYFKDNEIKIKAIRSGGQFNLALDVNGNVWSWGNNYDGKCGIKVNDTDNQDEYLLLEPKLVKFEEKEIVIDEIECGSTHSYCRSIDNRYYMFGDNWYGQCWINNNEQPNVTIPTCINDIIETRYKNKTIQNMQIGYQATVIKLS